MQYVRTFILGAIATACLCRCVSSGALPLAPPPPRPQLDGAQGVPEFQHDLRSCFAFQSA
jgi:hypothetical protein